MKLAALALDAEILSAGIAVVAVSNIAGLAVSIGTEIANRTEIAIFTGLVHRKVCATINFVTTIFGANVVVRALYEALWFA